MNSNNIELSLLENEIEKLQSKYQLPTTNSGSVFAGQQTSRASEYQENIL